MRVIAEFGLLLLLASVCVAQGATAGIAEIRKVRITRTGDKTRLEFVLTRHVDPKLTIATEPDRLVLDLSRTRSSSATTASRRQSERREASTDRSQQH